MCSTTCANTLVTSLAIICFQFCPIRWFLLLQSVNKHWFSIGSNLSLSRKCLTFDDTWRKSSESNVDFLCAHPQYRELMKFNLKVISDANFSMLQRFSCVKTITLDFTPQFRFEPHHLFPASLEILSLDICEIDNISQLSLSSTVNPNLRTVNLWFYQDRDYHETDKTIVESILLPLSNLTSLHLQSIRRFTGWIEQDILRMLEHLQQLKKFQTNFIFSRPALWDLNRMLSEDFILELASPRGYSPPEQEWFENINQLLNEQPQRIKHWSVLSWYSDLNLPVRSQTCFKGFQRMVKYLPLVCKPLREENLVLPSKHFESIEQWSKLAQCRKLKEIILIFETPLLVTLSHIEALRPVYNQLTYFRLKTIQLSINTFTILKEEIRLNIKGLVGCEEPLQNVHFLSTFQENELLRMHRAASDPFSFALSSTIHADHV